MRKSNNFIQLSIMAALSFLKDAAFCDEYALKKGLLQSLDPRVKAFTFLLFILAAVLAKNIFTILFLYALCLLMAQASGINLGFFLKRTWVFIPLFSLCIAIPAVFSIFTPGEALVTVNFLGFKLIITRQGLSGALLFVARVTASVSFGVLLSITTRHFELLKALRAFAVPQVFVMTIGMCYRYVYLFAEIIEHTYLAIKSRVGVALHYKAGQRLVAWNIAGLWQRSYHLNDDVYRAMLSRGYSGEPQVMDDFKIKAKDLLWLSGVILICVLLYRYRSP